MGKTSLVSGKAKFNTRLLRLLRNKPENYYDEVAQQTQRSIRDRETSQPAFELGAVPAVPLSRTSG